MAFKLGPINLNAVAQGVGGLVFGNGDTSEDDDKIEMLLERISNGVLADDRRAAIAELRDAVTDSRAGQAALGAMGIPVLMSVLRDDREDIDLVRGALEVLVAGLASPAEDSTQSRDGASAGMPSANGMASHDLSQHRQQQGGHPGEWGVPGPGAPSAAHLVPPPGVINSELFAREPNSVALLLGLLEEEDFYVRYHTLQLLTILLSSCPQRLQDAILVIPQGVGRIMDMMQSNEREVIRNEALVLMINLTRSAEEIQKIVVFEGVFERAFKIIHDEGAPDGGVVVQDSLELLSNLLRGNPSNQGFLRETMGLSRIPHLLALAHPGAAPGAGGQGGDVGALVQGLGADGEAFGVSRQKAANLLCALEMILLLLARNPEVEPPQDTNLSTNQTLLGQAKLMDALLDLALGPAVPVPAVRAQALRALGCLVAHHTPNRDELSSKRLPAPAPPGADREAEGEGEAPLGPPALPLLLRFALKGGTPQERSAADFAIKCFCEGNPEGQSMLASTVTPLPQGSASAAGGGGRVSPPPASLMQRWAQGLGRGPGKGEEDALSLSFGGMLVRALLGSPGSPEGLESCCRAANILSHILQGNTACKERVLSIPLEIPTSAVAPPELLMPRIMRFLAAAAPPVGAPPAHPQYSQYQHPYQQQPPMNSWNGHTQGRQYQPSPYSPHPGGPGAPYGSQHAAWLQPALLRLLFLWLADCPPAVAAFLHTPTHLPYLVDLCSPPGTPQGVPAGSPGAPPANVHVPGLAALVLGACVVFNQPQPQGGGYAGSVPGGPLLGPGTVLDIITQRIGLSSLFARLEELALDPLFVRAAARPRPPVPLTRVSAAEAVSQPTNPAAPSHPPSGPGSLGAAGAPTQGAHAPPNYHPGAPLSAASGGSVPGAQEGPGAQLASLYDPEFVAYVRAFEERMRARIMELFAQPRGGPVPIGGPPGGTPPGDAPRGGPSAGPGAGGERYTEGPSGSGGGGGGVPRDGQGGALGQVQPYPGESLEGFAARMREVVLSQQRELKSLQDRNGALAREAMAGRASAGPPGGPGPGAGSGAAQPMGVGRGEGPGGEGAEPGVHRGGAEERAQLEAELEGARASAAAAEARAQAAEAALAASAPALAEVDALSKAAEGAAQEAGELREEREALGSEVRHWRAQAEGSEQELQALSEAYAGLEQARSALEDARGRLEARVATLEQQLLQQQQQQGLVPQPGGGVPGEGQGGGGTGGRVGGVGGASAKEVEAAREAGREAGQEEARAEGEGELNDLLVCLGQEERKVEVLSARLEALGESAEEVLAAAGVEEGEGEDEEEEDIDFDELDK